MGRKKLFFLLLLLPLLISYNNCSQSSGDTTGSSVSDSTFIAGGNGGGFPGKASFDFFSPDPACADEWGQASRVMHIDFNSQQASLEKSTCDSKWSGPINYGEILQNGYSPYIMYYDHRVYVSPQIHEGVAGHLYYLEFCFNEVLQEDFTIQYIEEPNPSGGADLKKYVGVTMYGPQAPLPGIRFNGGFMDFLVDGSKLFTAHNGTYVVEMDAPTGGTEKARYIRKDGTVIPMVCWIFNNK